MFTNKVENMEQVEFNEQFRRRTRQLALDIIRLTSKIKYSDGVGIIRKQLIKSTTSTAANFRAVCRARSERERYAKLCIVVEESDETDFWLDMIVSAEYITAIEMADSVRASDEITKVMSSFKKAMETGNKINLITNSPDH